MGGYLQGTFLDTVQRFTMAAQGSSPSWETLPSLSTPRAFAGAAALGGHLFVLGGGLSDSSLDSVLRSGQGSAECPFLRSLDWLPGHFCLLADRHSCHWVHAEGLGLDAPAWSCHGGTERGMERLCEEHVALRALLRWGCRYDAGKRRWEEAAPMSVTRHSMGAVALHQAAVYAIGGGRKGCQFDLCERCVARDWGSTIWPVMSGRLLGAQLQHMVGAYHIHCFAGSEL